MSTKKAMNCGIGAAAVMLAVVISQNVNATWGDGAEMITGGNNVAIYLGGNLPSIVAYVAIGLLVGCLIAASTIQRSVGHMAAIAIIALIPALLFGIYLPDPQSGFLLLTSATAMVFALLFTYLGQSKLAKIPVAPEAPSEAMTAAERSSEHSRT